MSFWGIFMGRLVRITREYHSVSHAWYPLVIFCRYLLKMVAIKITVKKIVCWNYFTKFRARGLKNSKSDFYPQKMLTIDLGSWKLKNKICLKSGYRFYNRPASFNELIFTATTPNVPFNMQICHHSSRIDVRKFSSLEYKKSEFRHKELELFHLIFTLLLVFAE